MEVAKEYAEALLDGEVLPPVTAYYDGTDYWLADGFHRTMAHEIAEVPNIDVVVHQGSRRDAVLHSVGANATHGCRRTAADKRRAVLTLLNDPEWASWSDREIARRCAVDGKTVATLRPKLTAEIRSEETRIYTDRHGNASSMKVGAIGKARPPLPLVAGRVPDHKPMPADIRPSTGACGLHEAAAVTGFEAKRLKAFAHSGEIEHVQERGRITFEHEKLHAWMEGEPAPAESQALDLAMIPQTTPEQDELILRLLDLFEGFGTFGAPSDALHAWSLSRGQDISPESVASAAAWMAEFSVHFPNIEAKRQTAVQAMLERLEADVAN
jgi:hypothetical protein